MQLTSADVITLLLSNAVQSKLMIN